ERLRSRSAESAVTVNRQNGWLTMSVVAPNISLATEEGEAMNRRQRVMSIGTALGLIALTAYAPAWRLLAQSPPVALRGHVSSDTEPAMEGVIVTAKGSGATIATSVVT